MIFITVARNLKMYEALVKNNKYNQGAEFVYYDNNQKNVAITKRYNHFLDNYNYDKEDWFIFCHEDWQVKKAWFGYFKILDKDSVYGVCGTLLAVNNHNHVCTYFCGQIKQCNKDGSNPSKFGNWVKIGTEVETFDCMCIIMHSSLVKKHNIRFDENLDWHLYSEELSIRFKEDHGIKSRILPVRCKHWSYGVSMPNADFDAAFNYVANKHRSAENLYATTVTNKYIGNNKAIQRGLPPKSFWSFLFRTRVSKSGRLHIKIFNITVFSINIQAKNEIK